MTKADSKTKTDSMTEGNTAERALSLSVSPELLLEVARTLESAPSWVIFSHLKLDGDALGTATALFEAGTVLLNKRVRWVGPDPVPPSYFFLPHTDKYVAQKEYSFDSEDDLYIFLDSANEDRGVKGLQKRSPSTVVLNIDHHGDNSRFGTLNCVDSGVSSTSELLWHIMTAAGWTVTSPIAECLYTGIVADTGGFTFSNTTRTTHHVAADLLGRGADPTKISSSMHQNRSLEGMHLWGVALGRVCCWGDHSQFSMSWLAREDFKLTRALPSDTEMLVNQMLLIRGVRFAVLLTEDDEEKVKVSFRSKEGIVTAASVAHMLGGGGHPRAAGAHLSMPLDKAILAVREILEKAYAEWVAADR
ncbi:MAG: bifunctional oligoribonuclease/PAP phosphatase NrnA [Synergistaceae bacterium]|nr:bifunctional oligoribonuclease/PAP phosphatase NrnA [Synergistaceae bacterium]